VLAVSNSPALAGWVAFALTLPALFFQIPAGVAADACNRRQLMLAAQALGLAATAAVALALVFESRSIVAICFVAAFIEGTAFVFFSMAEVGAVRDVVHEEERTAAFSFMEAEQPVANLSGRAFGGALFGVAQWFPFFINAFSYLFCLLTLAWMPKRLFAPRPEDSDPTSADAEKSRFWRRMGDGLTWTWRIPFLRLATFATGFTNMLFQGVILLILVIGVREDRPIWTVGVVLAAAGVGGLAGSFAAPWFDRNAPPRTLFLGSLWAWTALLLMIALSKSTLALLMAWAGVGAVGAVVSIVLTMARVRSVPDSAIGKVVSAAALITDVAFPLGAVLAGYLLTSVGPDISSWLIFAAAAAFAAVCTRFLEPLPSSPPPSAAVAHLAPDDYEA
jgi:predicted MFS family arabinose efflux permease